MAEVLEKVDKSDVLMGLCETDTLLGILAVASEKQRQKHPGETIGFSSLQIVDGIHSLAQREEYWELHFIDFDRVGDNYGSYRLSNFLFFNGKPLGPLETVFESGRAPLTYMPAGVARRKIDAIKREYGQEAQEKVERMGADFLAYFESKRQG